MRAPRRPRDWLARALRATADRLAPPAPTGAAEPAAPAPRRPDGPPEHWRRLVAAHAPGLLRDLPHPASTPHADEEPPAGFGPAGEANPLIDGDDRSTGDGWDKAGEAAAPGGTAGPPATTRPGQPDGTRPEAVTARPAQPAPARTERPGNRGDRPAPPETHRGGRPGDGRSGARTADGVARRGRTPDGARDADGARTGASGRDEATDATGTDDPPGGGARRSGTDRAGGRRTPARPGDGAPAAARDGGAPRSTTGDAVRARRGPDVARPAPPPASPGEPERPVHAGPGPAGWAGAPPDQPAWRGDAPARATRAGRAPDDPRPATDAPRSDRRPTPGLRAHPDGRRARRDRAPTRPAAPEWTGATPGHWPTLPDEATAVPGGTAATRGADHRPGWDPWPALPDDRELWRPAAGPTDAAYLRRLDREQAGA